MIHLFINTLLIALVFYDSFSQIAPMSEGFVKIGEKLPSNLTHTENAVLINFTQGPYGKSNTEPTFDEFSRKFVNDLNLLGIAVNLCVDQRALNIPEIKDAYYNELKKLNNPNIINTILMCGNRNGSDFCSFVLIIGKADQTYKYLFAECVEVYMHTTSGYNNLVSNLKKNIQSKDNLKASPEKSQTVYLSTDLLDNNELYAQLPEDFKNGTLLIQKYEKTIIPEKVPKCVSTNQINTIESSNSRVDLYNNSMENQMKNYKGNYKFVGFNELSEYYGKDGYYLLSVIQSTNSEITRKKFEHVDRTTMSGSSYTETRSKKKLVVTALYYLFLKDMKTGAIYFMNYNNGKARWEECMEDLVKMSGK